MLRFSTVVEDEWWNGECGMMLPNEFDDLSIKDGLLGEERK